MSIKDDNILAFDSTSRAVEGPSSEQIVLGSFSRILADTARLTAHLADANEVDPERAKILELLALGASSILQANHRYLLRVAAQFELMAKPEDGFTDEDD